MAVRQLVHRSSLSGTTTAAAAAAGLDGIGSGVGRSGGAHLTRGARANAVAVVVVAAVVVLGELSEGSLCGLAGSLLEYLAHLAGGGTRCSPCIIAARSERESWQKALGSPCRNKKEPYTQLGRNR